MAATEKADDGTDIPVYSIPMDLIYSAGQLSSILVEYGFNTYRQTFIYDGTGANVVRITGWEKQ